MVSPVEITLTLHECSNCKKKYTENDTASKCCLCRICGKPKDHTLYNGECRECLELKYRDRAHKLIDEAELIPYDPNLVYHDNNDKWLYDDDDVHCYLVDNFDISADLPEYLYVSNKINFCINAEGVIENALDEHHEDALDNISRDEETKLQALLDKWCDDQKIFSWDGSLDKKVAVMDIVKSLGIRNFSQMGQ